jgi:hypothetical protein
VTATNNLQLLFPPIGLRLKLDRTIDRLRPCCDNIATVDHGRATHCAGLRCSKCGRHRGWLPREGFQFLTNVVQRFGAPAEPIILRDQQIGSYIMADKQYDNSGILFRNEDKSKDTDRDYRGSATIAGVEYWVSGWIKEAKSGSKFLKFSFKAKDAAAAKPKSAFVDDTDDAVGF